jgi:hypothetical protein
VVSRAWRKVKGDWDARNARSLGEEPIVRLILDEVEARRKAFLRKWLLKCRAVADSLEEAGDRLFTFIRFPPS